VLRYSIRLSVMVIVLGEGFVIAATDPQDHLFAVKGVVVDESGAVVPNAEVVFKEESGTIVAHAGMDGSVNVNLGAGKYVVRVSALGFATTKLVDFSVPSPTADAFHVILKAGSIFFGSGSPHVVPLVVPTVPSELPDVIIKDEPTPTALPVVQLATTKRRSMRCLYLWRCSAS
jgi:Carboxypeptidase regulatory-like domain